MNSNNTLMVETGVDCLKICTLGRFSMKRGDVSIGDDNKRSQRPWILLKYLLTHHDKQIVQEDFFDIIWQDGECDNPVKALQNLVYRLRQMLNKDTPAECIESSINFNQGCYSWNKHYPYQLDTDEFEDLYNRASQAYRMGNQHHAAELFTSALHLYKGDYLSDLSFNDWVIPARNHYRQLYLDALTKMVQMYKDFGKLQEILNICENALMIDPYEEKFHEYIIETLIEMGRLKLAQTHYEYVTAMLYKDLGVKPSPSLRGLFRRLKVNNEDVQMDLNAIKDCLMEKVNCDQAFLCDKETFQSMYKVECRRLPRSGQSVFLAMLTTTCANYELPDRKSLKVVADVLVDIIRNDLRSGDVLTKWNESQFLVMLPGTTFEQADKITVRIQRKFELKCKEKDIVMRSRVMPIGDVAKQNLSTSFL